MGRESQAGFSLRLLRRMAWFPVRARPSQPCASGRAFTRGVSSTAASLMRGTTPYSDGSALAPGDESYAFGDSQCARSQLAVGRVRPWRTAWDSHGSVVLVPQKMGLVPTTPPHSRRTGAGRAYSRIRNLWFLCILCVLGENRESGSKPVFSMCFTCLG